MLNSETSSLNSKESSRLSSVVNSRANSNDEKMRYYKSFSKKDAFRALYEPSDSETFSSSDEECTSSSDDFPQPDSPKKRDKHREDKGGHNDRGRHKDAKEDGKLYNKVKDLQKKLYEMQLKQKNKVK